jgi:hypothetical protein
MSFLSPESLHFLVGIYWPYLAGAAAIGLVSGWLFAAPRRKRGS